MPGYEIIACYMACPLFWMKKNILPQTNEKVVQFGSVVQLLTKLRGMARCKMDGTLCVWTERQLVYVHMGVVLLRCFSTGFACAWFMGNSLSSIDTEHNVRDNQSLLYVCMYVCMWRMNCTK